MGLLRFDHHYCPLALLHLHKGRWRVAKDLRQLFAPFPLVSTLTEKPRQVDITELTKIVEVLPDERPAVRALFEECTSEEKLHPGDLISLVPGRKLHVVKANRDNACLVFGVVSDEKEKDEERRFRVIIYGRARCKVTESVEAGDLLTVSEVEGCATKTGLEHRLFRPGTILGKALDTYEPADDDNTGMIEIMVTLLLKRHAVSK